MFVCNDEIIRSYFVVFSLFFVLIAKELAERQKSFLNYINQSACMEVERLEDFNGGLALQEEC